MVSKFYEAGELDSHTIREFRDGKTLPKEGTLPVLARRLAAHGIRNRMEERDAELSEVEFELRVAVAVSEERGLAQHLVSPRAEEGIAVQFGILRQVLRSAPDVVTADLLRHGTQARWWPHVAEQLQATLLVQSLDVALHAKADLDRRMAAAKANPAELFREAAGANIEQAAYLRSIDPRPGADGPEKRSSRT